MILKTLETIIRYSSLGHVATIATSYCIIVTSNTMVPPS